MSLFSSLNLARQSLGAHQTAIQTVGQNIANANTEGYARQRAVLRPTAPDDRIFAFVGTGVEVTRIERIVDEHLETTLRGANSDLGNLTERNRVFSMVETILSDLDGGGLSDAMARFFDSVEDLANEPQDPSVRGLVVEEARTLTETFHYLDAQIRNLRGSLNTDIETVYADVNRISQEIADLNRNIGTAEAGGVAPGSANDLRTQRDALLTELSELVDVKVIEQTNGMVQVVTGSDVLVVGSRARTLEVEWQSDGDISFHTARFEDDGMLLRPNGGRLQALLNGRDGLMVQLRQDLDQVAQQFLTEFNAIHAGGEGTSLYTELAATNAVTGADLRLSEAGLPFPIEDGQFTFQVRNEGDGTRESYVIALDLDGTDDDTTLQDLADMINTQVGVDHPEISARVTVDGHLEIQSSDDSLKFTFRDDNTGALTALGLGTLFTGTSALNIDVRSQLMDNPTLLASGRGAGSGDNTAVLDMLGFRDKGLLGPDEKTVEEFYVSIVAQVGVRGAEARDLLLNQEAITTNLQNQRESVSGVNVDEEAIELIQLQRAYQGSARFLTIVDRLLETLLNSV
ncbi:MAG: flagellar hook-associated protein FlgK [Planctomycetota bacterium]